MKFVKFALKLFLACFLGLTHAQSGTDLTLSKLNLTAGDTLELTIGPLDAPLSCDTFVYVTFNSPLTSFGVGANGKKGDTTIHAKDTLLKDLPTGDYVSTIGRVNPCPGYGTPTEFPVPKITLSIRALAKSIPAPTKADVRLSVTQKQFFDTKAADLDDLETKLNTRLAENSVDDSELKKFLVGILNAGQAALSVTEAQYRALLIKPADKLPPFFDDFHYQYNARLDELRAQLKNIREPISLVRNVGLQSLPQKGGALNAPPERKSVGVFPQDATTVKDLIRTTLLRTDMSARPDALRLT